MDLHQHLWTAGLWEALARRAAPPRLRLRTDGGGWRLELHGEAPFALGPAPQDPRQRAEAVGADGLDLAVVALSSALGVEQLPPDEARAVLDAFDGDADGFPDRLAAWGSVALADAAPADVDALLDRGRVGLCLPATALATPALLDGVGPLLERLEQRGAPLFVHPGPAAPGSFLAPLTDYLASLSAAWHAFALHGRRDHPQLRVLFAALAGLAPLHAERLAARGHAAAARDATADDRLFYDTSSYGPLAIDAVVRATGPGALVHGSDWPYAEARLPGAPLAHALLEANPAALLRGGPAAVAA
jgi:predicted TIM-barrel fold metal-dependent hydrolase